MEVVASLSQGRTSAAQCGLFTYKSVPVIFEPPCTTKSWNLILAFCNLVHFLPSVKWKCRSNFEISEIGLLVCLGVLVMWR